MENLYEQKMKQAIEYLNEFDIDLWLIYASEGSDPSVSLLTGLKTVGRTFFLVTKSGERYAIASIIDAQESEDSGLFNQVLKYTSNPGEVLNELLLKLNPNNIALNYSINDHLCDGLTRGRYLWLEEAIDERFLKRFISSEVFLKKLRSIKTSEEIARIKKAIDITIEIYDEVFSQLKPGLSEVEVGELFVQEMKKRSVVNGLSRQLTPPMVLKDRIAHREPSRTLIKPGDFLIIDFSVEYQGYVSDIARTAYFLKDGEVEAPQSMQDRFEAVYEAVSLVKDTIKPGMKGYELDSLARNHLLDKGMPEITHATGHQVGRYTHDGGTLLGPRWERYGSSPYEEIEENMVFTIEPTILFSNDDYSILSEEIIIVRKDGAEFLSDRQKNIILIDN